MMFALMTFVELIAKIFADLNTELMIFSCMGSRKAW